MSDRTKLNNLYFYLKKKDLFLLMEFLEDELILLLFLLDLIMNSNVEKSLNE